MSRTWLPAKRVHWRPRRERLPRRFGAGSTQLRRHSVGLWRLGGTAIPSSSGYRRADAEAGLARTPLSNCFRTSGAWRWRLRSCRANNVSLQGFRREATVSDLCRREEQQGLEDDVGASTPPWNKLTSQEIDFVLTATREMPELSCRQLAPWTTDNMGFSVSESTVYRILRKEGLLKRPEMRLVAGKEYHRKTTGPHQMWATDASYFRVVAGATTTWSPSWTTTHASFWPKGSEGYDIRLLHRSSPGGRGQDRHGPDPDIRPDQAAERQRSRLCIPGLQGLPEHGGHQTHTGNTLPPSDQRQAGALPPDTKAGCKPTAL